jgi:RHS repeat-associated protein
MKMQGTSHSYRYDALDRLAAWTSAGQGTTQRFYRAGQLSTEAGDDCQHVYVEGAGHLLVQQHRTNEGTRSTLLATDGTDSVLAVDSNPHASVSYSPYGHRDNADLLPGLPGFNGERPDSLTGHYLLGNGYRAFNPVLMRFNSPDSLSPFTANSLNAYAYCVGDPVNRIDPSGHLSSHNAANIGLGALGILVSVATISAGTPLAFAGFLAGLTSNAVSIAQLVTEENYPEASEVLGWVAMGLGAASLGSGLGAASRAPKVRDFLATQSMVPGRFSARRENGLNVHRPTRVEYFFGENARVNMPLHSPGSHASGGYRVIAADHPGTHSGLALPLLRARIGTPGFHDGRVRTYKRALHVGGMFAPSQRNVRVGQSNDHVRQP